MSPIGHPDDQDFPQWIGPPYATLNGAIIGTVLQNFGPFSVSNFASVILAINAEVGNVTATLSQQISDAPLGLAVVETFNIAAGSTLFEAVVLTGNLVTLQLQGSNVNTECTFALYPANTTTNSAVSSSTVLNFLHNGVVVKAEPGLDLEDAVAAAIGVPGLTWTTADTPGVSVAYTPVLAAPLTPVLSHVEKASGTSITATTEGTAQVIVTSGACVVDGSSTYILEAFISNYKNASANANEIIMLFHDDTAGVAIGQFHDGNVPAALNAFGGGTFRKRFVPAAGTRTYSLRAFVANANGVNIQAGAGGAGQLLPCYIEVRKEV